MYLGVRTLANHDLEENEVNDNDEVPEIDSDPSHGTIAEMEAAQNNQVNDDDAGSSSVNDDPEVSPEEWDRWYQFKESVEKEDKGSGRKF